LNPNDPKAKERFQILAEAYEILGNDDRRKHYDLYGSSYQQQQQQSYGGNQQQSYYSPGSQQQQYYYYGNTTSAEDIFKSVFEDSEMVVEELKAYSQELQDEFTYASESLVRGDWNEAYEVAKSHKALIIGIVVPLVVLTRSPAAFIWGARLAFSAGQFAVSLLLLTGNLHFAANWLWNRIKLMAIERRKRREKAEEAEKSHKKP
jgi:hypothetical protein